MVQASVPTPSQPVQPQECGDRTANILKITGTESATGISATMTDDGNGATINGTAEGATRLPTLSAIYLTAGTYTLIGCPKGKGITLDVRVLGGGTQISGSVDSGNGSVFTITTDGNYRVCARVPQGVTVDNLTIYPMVTSGSVIPVIPAEYEPYGYKIPIACGGATSTIYLSEPLRKIGDYADTVNSDGTVTRMIKQDIFTGTETDWALESINSYGIANFRHLPSGRKTGSDVSALCTHFARQTTSIGNTKTEGFYLGGQGHVYIRINSTTASTVETFTNWLKSQSDVNTPVTFWYPLATPTAETVTCPTITPASGSNTLSIGTTLAPSKVSITGMIKEV